MVRVPAQSHIVRNILLGATIVVAATVQSMAPTRAQAPKTTVDYQPMVSTGLAANQPFEAWFVFDKSPDPHVPGYAVPAGATMRLTFPKEFSPLSGEPHLEGALLHGWPHGAIAVPFTVTQDKTNPRVVTVRIEPKEPASPRPAEK